MADTLSLKNKAVMVTGGAGFIGSHLVDRLIAESPSRLVVVDNFSLGKDANLQSAKATFPGLKVYRQDASDYPAMKNIFETENIEVVFNLAVVPLPASLVHPGSCCQQNFDIVLSLCELARENYFKTLVHYSSSEAYGTCQQIPMGEAHPINPTTPYAASKAAGDLLVLSYIQTFGLDATILRPFNNYGPRQNEGNYAGVIPLTVKRILAGEAPVIYGDGEQTRDFIFVKDTVRATLDMYRYPQTRGKVVNVGSGREITINALIKTIAQEMGGAQAPVYQPDRPADVRRHIGDIALARQLIGFKPEVDFAAGMKETVKWYVGMLREQRK